MNYFLNRVLSHFIIDIWPRGLVIFLQVKYRFFFFLINSFNTNKKKYLIWQTRIIIEKNVFYTILVLHNFNYIYLKNYYKQLIRF